MDEPTFHLVIASDQEHERLVAEIYWGDRFVCLLSNEDGILRLEVPSPDLLEERLCRVVELEDFLAAVEHERRELEG